MATVEELAGQESVQRWYNYYSQHWGAPPDWDFKLQALARFSQWIGKTPDQMIGECLREVEGGYKKIRVKKRRFYIAKIKEFEESIGGVQGRNWANAVRSFFIHNGVAMSADILR
jgi:hypothetical protein